jgi:LmbE family N-acetylglucosaminyl deacetylase
VLAPHADDEVIGCGGTLALHADQGDAVRVLVAFDGAAADAERRWAPERYVRARMREALAGGRALACGGRAIEYEFWGAAEGHVPTDEELGGAALRLAALLDELRPATIYAPWSGDGHRDHRTLAAVLARALRMRPVGADVWGFEVWTPLEPHLVIDVSRVMPRKLRALACHATQLEGGALLHRVSGLGAYRSLHVGGDATFGEAFRTFDAEAAA